VILTAIKNGRFNPAHDARGEVPESAPGVKPGEAMPLETDGAPDTARQQVPPFFAKMLNIVAAAALISVIHQSVFVAMTGRAGLFEYIAVPLFAVFVAPTIFYFTVSPARQPMKTHSTPTTMAIDRPRLNRKLLIASSTTMCCW